MSELNVTAFREAWQRHYGQGREQDPGRARALEAFLARGFPGTHEEDWRYTNLDSVRERSQAWLENSPPTTAPADPGSVPWPGPVLHLADGQDVVSLPGNDWPEGLSLRVLDPAEADFPGEDGDQGHPIMAWNRAFLGQALGLETAPGADLPAPLRIVHGSSGAPAAMHSRLRLVLAPGSSLAVLIHREPGPAALATLATDILVGTGARLRLVRLQAAGEDVLQLERTRIRLARDARLELTSLDLGGRLVRQDLVVDLEGPGASASVAGLFLADGRRHLDNQLRLEHRAPHTTSETSFRGILDGSGRGVFNGKIIVRPGAGGTSADLNNRNLLLSRTAEIDTKPELEISVDDVKCSHGATTGQLDPAALFYLQSRGIGREEARLLLVKAFARDILSHMAVPAAGDPAAAALEGRLAGAAPAAPQGASE